MATSTLQEKLSFLHALLGGNGPEARDDAYMGVLSDVGHLVIKDISEKEVDIYCSLLFDKSKGLVKFLQRSATHVELQNSKVATLELLLSFASKVEKKIVPYAVPIKDVCLSLFAREKSSKVKNAVFPCLVKVLELTMGSQMGQELEVPAMIERFFKEIARPTKHSSTVKNGIYSLMGVFAEVYPEFMMNYAERLTDVCVKTIKTEMNKKDPDYQVLTGCFVALSKLLVHFTQSVEEDSKYSYDIFKHCRMALNPSKHYTRLALPTAVLDLLKRHAGQFNQYLFEDHQQMYETLRRWCNHSNRDIKQTALGALESFLKQVAEMLVLHAEQGKRETSTFKFFISQFQVTMDNKDASSSEVSLAIRGYGVFAAPCRLFLTSADVKYMFNEMMQRSDQIFFDENEVNVDKIHSLPSFLDALASIIKELEEIPEPFLNSLEKLIVVMMEHFPQLSDKMQYPATCAIVGVFQALFPKGPVLKTLLERTVYQGVIRTCSHPVVVETDQSMQNIDEDLKKTTYKDYLSMWKILVNAGRMKQGDHPEHQALCVALYDELISAILKVVEKLDLSSTKGEGMEDQISTDTLGPSSSPTPMTTSDPVQGLQARKPKDFQVFINLVDFCSDLLPHHHYDWFVKWTFIVGHKLIVLAAKQPLVSGFYKLLAAVMQICTKTSYFKDIQNVSVKVKTEDGMDIDEAEDQRNTVERQSAFVLFTKFTNEVLIRMKQFKDDLLASCLLYILALPEEIVTAEIQKLIPALQTAFKLGISYLPLASAGLDALEHWVERLPRSALQPYFPDVLPYLNDYLKSEGSEVTDEKSKGTLVVSSKGSSRKTKLAVKLLAAGKEALQSKDSELASLKQRIVQFLGSLGGRNNACMVQCTAADIARLAVAWDTHTHLKFDMPFMDMKATMYLDPFLPHVAELAVSSGDRQTKVAACELLHSIVLYMLGRSTQQTDHQREREPMDRLYKHILPILLQLACDVELVARQLFEPLMMQLIHWFTNHTKFESPETRTLLNSIMDGLVHPTNTGLRDFSARCTQEFLKWSIKQTTKKQQENNPINAKSLLKRIYSLALHPSVFRRLGAALAFNSIYRVFREEQALVDTFTFEILETFVASLALAHHDDKSLGTQEQCSLALHHLGKIIIHPPFAKMLSEEKKTRRKPRLWNKATLDIAVRWLMRQCGRPQTECRHACMELVFKLIPATKEFRNPIVYFSKFLKSEGPVYFIKRFECVHPSESINLSRCQKMTQMAHTFTVRFALNWFDLVLASLDCYCWVFETGVLNLTELFSGGNSCIFKVLKYFLDDLASGDIYSAADQYPKGSAGELFSPREIEDYNRMKCTVIVRVLHFLCVALEKGSRDLAKVFPDNLWTESLWAVVYSCVLEPNGIGFNMADIEVMENLPIQCERVLLKFKQHLPQPSLQSFIKFLQTKLGPRSAHLFRQISASFARNDEDHHSLSLEIQGYKLLQGIQLLMQVLQDKKEALLASDLLQAVIKSVTAGSGQNLAVASFSPSTAGLAKRLLELSFALKLKSSDLLGAILNKTDVALPGSHSSTKLGLLFYGTFQKTINEYLMTAADVTEERTIVAKPFLQELLRYVNQDSAVVSTVLLSLLDQASKCRKKEGATIPVIILSQWSDLTPWWSEEAAVDSKTCALNVLRKCLVVDSKFLTNPDLKSCQDVLQMYQKLLTDTKTALAFKSKVLDLLPFFTVMPDLQLTQMRESLDHLVGAHFPLKSSEYSVGTPKYKEYIRALDKILSAMELSGSVMLLELVISIMCKEKCHVYEDNIQAALASFIKRMPPDKQKAAVDVPFQFFTEEGRYPNEIRSAALERACLPLLRRCHTTAVKEFYLAHIKWMMNCLDAKLKASENAQETQLASKMCCFQLINLMYSRLSKDEVFSKNSAINQVYCDGKVETGKEMTQAALKLAHNTKKENSRGEAGLLELYRLYHCMAYNALIAIVSCTQEEVKFYTGFLFKEKQGEYLLDGLVDKSRNYTFEVELEALPQRKKKFVSIRQDVRGRRREEAGSSEEESVHYLASQYLADSSLSEDISAYDFSGSAKVFAESQGVEQPSLGPGRPRDVQLADPEDPSITVEEDYVEMEMDALNQHECMATMMALLQHMRKINIIPSIEKGTTPDMPEWMKYFYGKMSDSTTHVNVKLFIAKLIINTEEFFRPYARHWLSSIIQFIISGQHGPGLHYFVVDLVVTILGWASVAIPEDTTLGRSMTSRMVEYLMSNTYNESRPIMRRNLEMLKTLVECWKGRFEIPTKVIYQNFSKPESTSKENITGLQLLGVVLANQLPAYTYVPGVDREMYFKSLAMNMNIKHKAIYSAAAEVVGMTLHSLDKEDKTLLEDYCTLVTHIITGMQDKRPDAFITCVHKIHLHYVPLVDRFINKLLFMLPKLHGEFKFLCLESILSRVEYIDNVFMELKSKGLLELLKHRNEAIQLVSLKIVNSMLRALKPEDLLFLMPAITAFSSNPSVPCRVVMYEILIWVYDNYREEGSDDGLSIMCQTKDALLQGLTDEDLHNRLTVQNFWSHETRLPTGTLERMVAMLEAMYSPATEANYLSYATNLILEMTSKSPDYNREVFDRPLSECKFEDFVVKSSWKQRHAAMTPMFADTQFSQSLSSGSLEDSSFQGVRATQDAPQFTPTQTGISKAPYNWLTQSSMDTFADMDTTTPSLTSESADSSLLFSIGAAPKKARRRKYKPVGPAFGKDKLSAGLDQTDAPDDSTELEIRRLKRRFLKDHESTHWFHARRALRLKKMRQAAAQEQKERKEAQVTMYRKYRIGDLPDIQIKYSYIIAPLQALAQRDNHLAKLLFSSIFRAIYAEIDKTKTERESTVLTEQINKSLNAMLEQSNEYSPAFIGALLDIAYHETKRLKLASSNISNSAYNGTQQHLGIVLLEEMLIQNAGTGALPRNKRARGRAAPVSEETGAWIELARLYKSLNSYDVLHGVFSGFIGTKQLTREGLEAEARADFKTANDLYNQALNCEDWGHEGDPPPEEVGFWEDASMECLNHLTQWTKLETVALQAFDDSDSPDVEKVWLDINYQDHYLPFLMRSKMKQLLVGDEGQQQLLTFVDNAMSIPDRKAVLENHYCEELSLLYLHQEDYDRARYFADNAVQKFIQDWSGLDKLMVSSRTRCLQSLQKIVELQEMLGFVRKEDNVSSVSCVEDLVNSWCDRMPDCMLDPTDIWDDVVGNRLFYIDVLVGLLSKASGDTDTASLLREQKTQFRLAQVESAKEQNNFTLALKYMREANTLVKQLPDTPLQFQFYHCYSTTHQKWALNKADGNLKGLVGSLGELEKRNGHKLLAEGSQLSREHFTCQCNTYDTLVSVLQTIDYNTCDRKTMDSIAQAAGCDTWNKSGVLSGLIEQGFSCIQKAVKGSTGTSAGDTEAVMTLVKYCDKYLRQSEEADESDTAVTCDSMNAFPSVIINGLLNSMKLNSCEAMQHFPRLLQLVETYPDTMKLFIEKSSEVPCWMFISWIGQLVALLNRPESTAVHGILQQIADHYPQALIYPFKVTTEEFEYERNQQGKKNQAFVQRLTSTLSKVPMADKLISALDQFGQPNALFDDWMKETHKLLQEKKKNKNKINACVEEMYNGLLNARGDQSRNTTQSLFDEDEASQMGKYRKRFAQEFGKQFEKEFGKQGSSIQSMSIKEFANKAGLLKQKMDEEVRCGKLLPPAELNKYSEWMTNLSAADQDMELEIPGQYSGTTKPLPQYHVKIVGFDDKVKVMSSMRKPKAITMRGSDEKEYKFLVKGGEDLRQDQRLEQLFTIMNAVFKHDQVCKSRHYQLRTYQVIPMTTRVGLIEWVEHTLPLKNFLENAWTEDEKKFLNSPKGPKTSHGAFVEKHKKAGDKPGRYFAQMYMKVGKNETVKAFQDTESKYPWDISRRAFKKMSTSPEAFFTLRNHFAESHALLCVCNYIVGIGDRHLSNFMVDLDTGGMVGIDFGHAFGSATQFLPVPELMPFRLTRQLLNLMLPLKEKGLFERTMVHALRALRNSSQLLLNTMDVFVKDQSVDWKANADRQKITDVSADETDIEWYPKEKVAYARRKLQGANPWVITKDELTLGFRGKEHLKSFISVAKGDGIRSKMASDNLTVEQQVACLIDQATDPNILGRTWIGWEPYV